jgi:hypothetical protein
MPSIGQTVIVTKGLAERDAVKAELEAYLARTFLGTDTNIKTLSLGPPVGRRSSIASAVPTSRRSGLPRKRSPR